MKKDRKKCHVKVAAHYPQNRIGNIIPKNAAHKTRGK
jgi:hypothetical protein